MDINVSLLGTSSVHPKQIDSFIWSQNPDAPPVGSSYVLYGRVYEVQAHIAAAQGIHETGWFRQRSDSHNPAGMMSGGKLIQYPSWREGIAAHCSLLRKYATEGTWFWDQQMQRVREAGTLRSMANVWAPPELQPRGMPGGDAYARRIADLAQSILDQPAPAPPGIADHWSRDHVQVAAANRILLGYEDGYIRPDWSVTRAELATILHRVKPELPPPTSAIVRTPLPDDVAPNHWASEYIVEVLSYGWMRTGAGGLFRPEEKATREEVAFALNMSNAPAAVWRQASAFPDVSGELAWAVDRAYRSGWFSGYPDGYFRPSEPVTRGELAAVLDRSFGWSRVATSGLVGALPRYAWQEAGWVERFKLWVSSSVAKLYYGEDELMATSYHLEPPEKVETPPFYAQPWFWVLLAGAGLGVYAVLWE